jgi:hypothetical protein
MLRVRESPSRRKHPSKKSRRPSRSAGFRTPPLGVRDRTGRLGEARTPVYTGLHHPSREGRGRRIRSHRSDPRLWIDRQRFANSGHEVSLQRPALPQPVQLASRSSGRHSRTSTSWSATSSSLARTRAGTLDTRPPDPPEDPGGRSHLGRAWLVSVLPRDPEGHPQAQAPEARPRAHLAALVGAARRWRPTGGGSGGDGETGGGGGGGGG